MSSAESESWGYGRVKWTFTKGVVMERDAMSIVSNTFDTSNTSNTSAGHGGLV